MTEQNAKRKAISYMRYSSGAQSKGTSFERQLKYTQMFAEMHNLELDSDNVFKEPGRSSFRGRHRNPGTVLGNLIERVRLPDDHRDKITPGTVLIVEALDRLTREKLLSSMSLLMELVEAGVPIGVVKNGKIYDVDTLEDNFIEVANTLKIANMESQFKSDMSKKNWNLKRDELERTGKKLTSKCPGWLRLNKETNEFEKIEDRVEIVKLIFKWCLQGISRTEIAARLNDDNKKTFYKHRDWTDSTIAVILANKAVYGLYYPGHMEEGTASNDKNHVVSKHIRQSEAIEGYFPPILTKKEYDDANEALRDRFPGRTKSGKGRKTPRFSNLLTKVATCAACGGPMHFKGSHTKNFKRDYLRCYNSEFRARNTPYGVSPCPNRHLHPYEPLEQFALNGLTRDYILKAIGKKQSVIQDIEEKLSECNHRVEITYAKLEDAIDTAENLTGKKYKKIETDDDRRKKADTLNTTYEVLLKERRNLQATLKEAKGRASELEGMENIEFTEYIESIEKMSEQERVDARSQLNLYFKQIYKYFAVRESGTPIIIYHNEEDFTENEAADLLSKTTKAVSDYYDDELLTAEDVYIQRLNQLGDFIPEYDTPFKVTNEDELIDLKTVIKLVYPEDQHATPPQGILKKAQVIFRLDHVEYIFEELPGEFEPEPF